MDDSKQNAVHELTSLNNTGSITSSNSNLFPVQENVQANAPAKEVMNDAKDNCKIDHRTIIKGCFELLCCCGYLCKCYDAGKFIKNPLVREPTSCLTCCENCFETKPLCACSCCDCDNYECCPFERYGDGITYCYECVAIKSNSEKNALSHDGCDQMCCWCTCCENNYLACCNCRLCDMEPGLADMNCLYKYNGQAYTVTFFKCLSFDLDFRIFKCFNFALCNLNNQCTMCYINLCEYEPLRHNYTCCCHMIRCGKKPD